VTTDEIRRVDAAIAAFDRATGSTDDLVLLLLRRADLAGIPITMEQTRLRLGLSEDEILDIFARLWERGFIEEIA